eukprot:TRINITY_DN9775_c0_g1_i1.p1 TRINITY_DN9775_c0_g1~~TRINITY_DN9775_c0_g1_i1.p1  ORF type:complete len:874 (+),score=131.58 TRINITY_DN9775_c0_g1_i1:188-2809(+)
MAHSSLLLFVGCLVAFFCVAVVQAACSSDEPSIKPAFDPESPRFLQRKEALAREAAKLSKPKPLWDPYNVTYDGRSLMINGQRKLLISGSIHYPRSSVGTWRSVLQQSQAAGLDVIETYVFWNYHEPVKGQLYFEDNADLLSFLELCQEYGFYVHLRIGPYVCSEWNYGGFPIWLKEEEGIVFRDNNAPFMEEMAAWLYTVVEIVRPLFASNGGPIIMAQVENEYNIFEAMYGVNGTIYANWSISYATSLNTGVPWTMCKQDNQPAAINTCNGWYCDWWLEQHFATFPDQPALWTEVWSGWFYHWQEPKTTRPAEELSYAILRWFAQGGSHINYYMWYGGTTFDRWVGGPFIVTSYDYGSALGEYGVPTTPKYYHLSHLHSVLHQYGDFILNSPIAQGVPVSEDGNLKLYQYGHESGLNVTFLINYSQNNSETTIDNEYLQNAYYVPEWSGYIIAIDPLGREEVVFNSSATSIIVEASEQQRSISTPPPSSILYWQEPIACGVNESIINDSPLPQLGITHDMTDYLWYLTNVTALCKMGCQLNLSLAGGATHLFINGEYQTSVYGNTEAQTLAFSTDADPPFQIQILNGGMGILNFGFHMELWDLGIMGPVVLTDSSNTQINLTSNQWEMKPGLLGENLGLYNLHPANWSSKWQDGIGVPLSWFAMSVSVSQSMFYSSLLAVDLTGLNKGFVWFNGRGIGRYWLIEGVSPPCDGCYLNEEYQENNCRISCGQPSQNYYHLPADWFVDGLNHIVVFEELGGDPSQINIVAFDSTNSTIEGETFCGFAEQNDWIGILCPPGQYIRSTEDTFFGNPSEEQCGSLQPGSCNSTTASFVAREACYGASYCFLQASTDVFGDPCPDIPNKSLSVQFVCA